MIARVTLELALRKEFDYLVPPELAGQVDVGSRVQVPFGPRKVLGCVTALAEESARARLKPILKVIGAQALVTPKILKLARWLGEYYCCAPEIALKAVLPEAVRHEKAGWRERLYVRAAPVQDQPPKLSKRQAEVWRLLQERLELPLKDLLELAQTTAATIRHLEDKGMAVISAQVSERDPYASERILPSQTLSLNPAQARALQAITAAMDEDGGRRAEGGGRRTEDGGRRAEGGGRRTEDGGRRTEDGGSERQGTFVLGDAAAAGGRGGEPQGGLRWLQSARRPDRKIGPLPCPREPGIRTPSINPSIHPSIHPLPRPREPWKRTPFCCTV